MSIGTEEAGRGKLTEAQWETLRRASSRPFRVIRGYKPAKKLASLGLVEIAVTDGPFAWIVAATTAGRAALSAGEE
ncbi:hypothetical protein SB2_11965 [Methylobacterium radiotolerans]|nr:hypothetical protein SB3_11160 [Methylobacterium radiotolerans]KTS48006.1 hypothetical protein SB2_11965 [Methylobacterium radiotolerans]